MGTRIRPIDDKNPPLKVDFLSRHAGDEFLDLFDLVRHLLGGRFHRLGFAKEIFGSPEFPFLDHDLAHLKIGQG